jgi:hypothetical protein
VHDELGEQIELLAAELELGAVLTAVALSAGAAGTPASRPAAAPTTEVRTQTVRRTIRDKRSGSDPAAGCAAPRDVLASTPAAQAPVAARAPSRAFRGPLGQQAQTRSRDRFSPGGSLVWCVAE